MSRHFIFGERFADCRTNARCKLRVGSLKLRSHKIIICRGEPVARPHITKGRLRQAGQWSPLQHLRSLARQLDGGGLDLGGADAIHIKL